MEDIHKIFSRFKKGFPGVHQKNEASGKEVHEKGGPLSAPPTGRQHRGCINFEID